jgi:macrolide-specific efflux system membrane fusion protein
MINGIGCGQRNQAGAQDIASETVPVARRQFASTVSAVGAVKPQIGAEVKVGARISGRVERLHANIKDQVRKGQVIAELEKADLEATVAQRRAEARLAEAKLAALAELLPRDVAKAEADMTRYEASFTLARKDVARQRDLLKEKISSQEATDQAQEKLAVAEAQLDAARKTLELVRAQYVENRKQAQAELDRDRAALTNAEVHLSYAVITAPISGVIGSVSTQEGETVAAGLNAPTFVTIIDLARLQVEAYVDEVDIGKVKVGQRAVFTVDAFPADDFEGKVVAIYPKATIQDNVVKYIVATEILSAYAGRLRPEMTTSVSLQLESREVLAIPAKAVRREGGKHVVWVNLNGRPTPREVKLGWKDGPWTEVASGLEAGQEIFLDQPETTNEPTT